MKAYEIRQFGIDELALTERDTPKPGFDQVLVRIKAASLNYRDLMVVSGTYNSRMKLPAVPFSDGAGDVVAIGEKVTRWQIGDRVCPIFAQGWLDGQTTLEKSRTSLGAGAQCDGILREYAAFSENSLVRIPDSLSFEEASTLPCAGVTAWNALTVSGKVKAGETVLTLGTGGVSVFAVQLAKMSGAQVIATTGSEEKAARLAGLGADHVINYKSREDWDIAVLELTGKSGVDHVIEVGGSGTLSRSLGSVRLGGHVAMIGALTGPGDFNPVTVFMKSVRLQGIFTGSRRMFEDLNRALEFNKVRPVIDRVFEFGEVKDALRYMQNGAHFGKIVVRVQ